MGDTRYRTVAYNICNYIVPVNLFTEKEMSPVCPVFTPLGHQHSAFIFRDFQAF